jgi:HEAT repeat protein
MHANRIHRLAGAGVAWQAAGLAAVALTLPLIAPGLAPMALAQPPGPELFAKEPRTPLELWDAVDYLLRTNQAKKALPYIDRFVKSKPDDTTWISIRNRYGPGSILQLNDDAATRPFAQPLVEAMVVASRKYATRPERIAQFVSELTKTPEEQDYAVRHLREAGPDAIPFLVEALARPDLSADDRRLIVHNMGRLDRSVIPALIVVLDSPNPAIAADAATVLGLIGNNEAIPFLTFPAASPETPPTVRAAAQAAIARLTGRPFDAQPRKPVQVLTDAAWRYHRRQVEFADDLAVIWAWDNDRKVPAARELPRTEAEGILGLQLARQTLRLHPDDREAQVVQISLALEKAIERIGFSAFPDNDAANFAAAKASGPSVLIEVLKTAVKDGKPDLAAAATTALGQVTNRAALTATGRPHPLVDALYAPYRRVQFAAARALVALSPAEPFPGSSRIVPTLARFVANQALPRAVVIDSNPTRGSQLAGFLISLGYDSELELSGAKGFVAAAESADVELILISFDLFQTGWRLNDTLANLQADSRTAAIPVFIYGPLDVQYKRPNLDHDYPGIKFLVQPVDADMLLRQLKGLPARLSEVERTNYAREAATLLARIATERKGPLTADLTAAEPALTVALNEAQTAKAVATVLGDVPDPDAQRSLADVVLDPSQAPAIRKQSASELVRSIRRFGRLITAGQEARLTAILREETDPEARANLLTILRALVPAPSGNSLKTPASPVPIPSAGKVESPSSVPATIPQPGANP